MMNSDELRAALNKKKSFVVSKETRSLVMDVLANKGVAHPHISGVPGLNQYTNSKEEMRRRLQPFFRKYKEEFEWFLVDTDEKTFVWNIDSEIRQSSLGVDVGKLVLVTAALVVAVWGVFHFGIQLNIM